MLCFLPSLTFASRNLLPHYSKPPAKPVHRLKKRFHSPATSTDQWTSTQSGRDFNQWIREGYTESEYVKRQAEKARHSNTSSSLSTSLPVWDTTRTADVAIIGCGPAGLSLAAEAGKKGLSVVLVGEDMPFVNTYGVWVEEFESIGLKDTLEHIWMKSVCFFGEEQQVVVDRAYGRVSLPKLWESLVDRCQKAGVAFHSGVVSDIDADGNPKMARLTCGSSDSVVKTRMVTLACGAAAGKFLEYESDAPSPGAQTAYGVEVEIEGYGDLYPEDKMLFMDYRRHHSGIWDGMAPGLQAGKHPNGGDGLWSSHGEVPTFLYAMPLGPDRVFLEETCLVSKPPLSFGQLKRRLQRRMEAMGMKAKQVVDEEWSYIPVGGPLPIQDQSVTAFGSAANFIHPASGYSISRSLKEAPAMAGAIAEALQSGKTVREKAQLVWGEIWSPEKRAQAAFHLFGMELLTKMELKEINSFFKTFFKLPSRYWKGFLSTSISSLELLVFAALTLFLAPVNIKTRLITHLVADPSSHYMIKRYFDRYFEEEEEAAE